MLENNSVFSISSHVQETLRMLHYGGRQRHLSGFTECSPFGGFGSDGTLVLERFMQNPWIWTIFKDMVRFQASTDFYDHFMCHFIEWLSMEKKKVRPCFIFKTEDKT